MNGDVPDSPRLTGYRPYGNDPFFHIHVIPAETHHFPRPDAGIQHDPDRRSAVTEFRNFHHLPEAFYFFRDQNGDGPFTERRRFHTDNGIFPAPAAPQGKGQHAAHHRTALVTLSAGGKRSFQKTRAMLRRQFPDREILQFRTPTHQGSGEIPDITQRCGTKPALRPQRLLHGGGKGNRLFPFPQFLRSQENCLSGPAHAAAPPAQAQQFHGQAGGIQHIQTASFQQHFRRQIFIPVFSMFRHSEHHVFDINA